MAEMMIKQKLDSHLDQDSSYSLASESLARVQNKITKAEEFFNELDGIYMDREKYSLHWAFDNASSRLNSQLDQIDKKKTKHDYTEDEFHHSIDDVRQGILRASRRYTIFSRLTLVLDIVISVALILGVTLIAQEIERNLESFLIVTLFIAIIALLKVSLDRFFIIPRVDAWGWNRYHSLTHRIGDQMASIILDQLLLSVNRRDSSRNNNQINAPSFSQHHVTVAL